MLAWSETQSSTLNQRACLCFSLNFCVFYIILIYGILYGYCDGISGVWQCIATSQELPFPRNESPEQIHLSHSRVYKLQFNARRVGYTPAADASVKRIGTTLKDLRFSLDERAPLERQIAGFPSGIQASLLPGHFSNITPYIMAIRRSDNPHASTYVLLVCISLSLASVMAQATPSQTSQDPSAHFEPLAGTMNPMSISVKAFNPQAQDVSGEVQPSSMAAAAAETGPLITTAPDSDLRPVPGGRAVALESEFNFPHMDLPVELGLSNPNPLAQSEPESASNSSNSKPTICASDPKLTFLGLGSIQSSICRAYFYRDSARSTWTVCTAWFATPTHAVLAGHCIADGGSRTFFPVAVGGRYGTVCCRTQSDTGPDNCQAGYGFNIIDFSTTRGWLNSRLWNNDGAVLKLVRPSPTLGGVGTPLKFGQSGNPSCPATVTYAGFPIRNNIWGCNNNWGERLGFSTTTGVISCTTQSDTPTGRYTGSACQGMSGGPMWNPSTNIVNGILSQGSLACSTTRTSTVSFAAISNSGDSSWGVHVAGLIAAIP
eukprot:jgi/Botrbrau1/2870/Bobra.0036s0015.1